MTISYSKLENRLRAENASLRERAEQAERERDALMDLIVRPWTREGDHAKMWKVHLAWFDTTNTRDAAIAMVREAAGLDAAPTGDGGVI